MEFDDTTQIFNAIKQLQSSLQLIGLSEGSKIIQEGFSSFNGLTDGWVLLLDSLIRVRDEFGNKLSPQLRQDLERIVVIVKRVIYRD